MRPAFKGGVTAAISACLLGALAASASAATLVATDPEGTDPYNGSVVMTAADIVLLNDSIASTTCDIHVEFDVDSDATVDVGDFQEMTFSSCSSVTPTSDNVATWSGSISNVDATGGTIAINDIEVTAGPCDYGGAGTVWTAEALNPTVSNPSGIDLLPSSFIPAQAPGLLCGTQGAALDGFAWARTPLGQNLWVLDVP